MKRLLKEHELVLIELVKVNLYDTAKSFKCISGDLSIAENRVRFICRSLKRKGFCTIEPCFNDYGLAGCCYSATKQGKDYIKRFNIYVESFNENGVEI